MTRLVSPGPAATVALADDAGSRNVPELCQAMLKPAGGYSPGEERNCLLYDEKCMDPATVIMTLSCPNGHYGDIAKCDPHGKDDGRQMCGHCAINGLANVPVTVLGIRRIRP